MVVPAVDIISLPAPDRIKSLIDAGTFKEYDSTIRSGDPLKFKGLASYEEKLQQNRINQTRRCGFGVGEMGGRLVSLAVMDFRFLGGSMGSVVGEKLPAPLSVGWK